MRKIKSKRNLIVIIVVVSILCTISVAAKIDDMWFQENENADVYIFPITPLENPDEWKVLESYEEMVEITQVPDEVLAKISTKGLIETCFNYPLFSNIFAYNSYNQGLDTLNAQFNGFQELYTRKDRAKELILFYRNIDYKSVVNSTDPYYIMRLRFIDYYIAQDEILSILSKEERDELLDITVNTLSSKSEGYSDIFSGDSTLYLAASIMIIDDKDLETTIYADDENSLFFEQGKISNKLAEVISSKLTEGGYLHD